MSKLMTFSAGNAAVLRVTEDCHAITEELAQVGVKFECWEANQPLDRLATDDEVIEAYHQDIDQLMHEYGFESVDVVSLTQDHPDKAALRNKFLSEHTHSDYEVRFFVDGSGLFYLHIDDVVYGLFCEKGNLISVPANVMHWFDMGESPNFKCIRLFTNQEGWVANYSGDDIAERFPTFEAFLLKAAA